MGTMARLFPPNQSVNLFVIRMSGKREYSRVGGSVHGNLVARVEDVGAAGQDLGHGGSEGHVPSGQEQGYFIVLVDGYFFEEQSIVMN